MSYFENLDLTDSVMMMDVQIPESIFTDGYPTRIENDSVGFEIVNTDPNFAPLYDVDFFGLSRGPPSEEINYYDEIND